MGPQVSRTFLLFPEYTSLHSPHPHPTTQTLASPKITPPAWTCLRPRAPTGCPWDNPPGGPWASPTQQLPNLPSSQVTPHPISGTAIHPVVQARSWPDILFSQPLTPLIPVQQQIPLIPAPQVPPESAPPLPPHSLNISRGPPIRPLL